MNNDIFFAPGITIRSLVHGQPRTNVVEPKHAAEHCEEDASSHEPARDTSSDAE